MYITCERRCNANLFPTINRPAPVSIRVNSTPFHIHEDPRCDLPVGTCEENEQNLSLIATTSYVPSSAVLIVL